MLQIKAIIATSHIDSDGEMIAPQALKQLADQINSCVMPMGVEHDPRIPPRGRLTSARFVQLADGAYAVEGEGEIFEPDDEIPLQDSLLEIPLTKRGLDELDVSFDASFRDKQSQEDIHFICDLLGTEPKEEIKKSVDPLSVLTIGFILALGKIGDSFLSKLGEDSYEALKEKVKSLMKRKESTVEERLLVFETSIDYGGKIVSCEVISTNPTDENIDSFFNESIQHLDSLIINYLSVNPETRKIVFSFDNNRLKLMFGVRKDAVPLPPIG